MDPFLRAQESLLCGCGASEFRASGRCEQCERRERLSRTNFGGLRELALARDDYQCQTCGELNTGLLLVHHRRKPALTVADLITLCRKCHVRIHHTWRPSFAFLTFALLRRLWREANSDLAEQRLLDLLARRPPPEQSKLF